MASVKKQYFQRKALDGVKKLKKISPNTILILEEAEKQGIAWEKLPYTDIFKLTKNQETHYFHSQIPSQTTELAFNICKNKRVAKNLLVEAGLSVSHGYLLKKSDRESYKKKLFDSLEKPLVVKPVDALQGDNVFLHINSYQQYAQAIDAIHTYYSLDGVNILVEQMFEGDEYRILTTRDKVLSIIKRISPNVVGDGTATIRKLIEVKNSNPLRVSVDTYSKIEVNDHIQAFLKEQDLTLDSVPEKTQQVFLLPKSASDITHGGDTIDVTDQVDPSVKEVAKKVIKSIPGLYLAGIDFMTKDIFTAQKPDNYRIIEVNASPSLDWNQYPLVGPERPIALEFLKIMFKDL